MCKMEGVKFITQNLTTISFIAILKIMENSNSEQIAQYPQTQKQGDKPESQIHPHTQKFYMFLIILGIIFLASVFTAIVYLIGARTTLNRQKYPSNSSMILSPTPNIQNEVARESLLKSTVDELADFPIYPYAKFVKKEVLPNCEGFSGSYTACNGENYEYVTNDNIKQILAWYDARITKTWVCSGGFRSPGKGGTWCFYKNTTVSIKMIEFGSDTVLQVLIPYGKDKIFYGTIDNWKTYQNKDFNFSFKYPSYWDLQNGQNQFYLIKFTGDLLEVKTKEYMTGTVNERYFQTPANSKIRINLDEVAVEKGERPTYKNCTGNVICKTEQAKIITKKSTNNIKEYYYIERVDGDIFALIPLSDDYYLELHFSDPSSIVVFDKIIESFNM